MGPYLGDLVTASPVTFVFGLPAMYKSIDAGLTLNGSQAISVWLSVSNGTLSGEASFYTANAASFADTYNTATAGYEKPVTAFPAEAGKADRLVVSIPTSDLNKSAGEIIASRHELKMLFFIMEAKDNVEGIASFTTKPWVNFFVKDSPPSVFVNYEIRPERVQALSDAVLPAGFVMKELRILESDLEPAYYLVLNFYTMTGLTTGVRYEWSVFAEDPENGKPRFMVIQALGQELALDPVNLWTSSEPVDHIHDVENGQLISEALQPIEEGSEILENYFTSIINWPPTDTPEVSSSTREFITTNDFLYWGVGVCDHGLYTGSSYNRNVTIIPPSQYQITDDTPWAEYVYSEPKSLYVYQNALDIIISTWWNLNAPNLDMTQEHWQEMVDIFSQIYPMMVGVNVRNAFNAQEEALLPFEADNFTPSAFFNYVISASNAAAFEATLGLPDGYSLDTTKILESDAQEEYYLTLKVFDVNGAVEGTRAEWLIYVDDGNGREHFMVIDLMTEDAALDPVKLLRLPSVVEHELAGNTLSTMLVSSTIDFSATLDIADGVEALHTLDWVEAFDYVCYLNGICDKNYFGEGTLEAPLLSIDPALASVSTSTPWSSFIGTQPSSVLLRTSKQYIVKKAWHNVRPATAP